MAEQNTEKLVTAATVATDDFSALLEREFKPRAENREAIRDAVSTLAREVLSGTSIITDDAITTITALIAEIDAKLTEQVNLILHHEDFQKLEGAWRGLSHLVNNTETDEMLKVRFLNVSKSELLRTFKKFKGVAWDQSPIYKMVYEAEYDQLGGHPYGCLVGDYYFDQSAPDVEILSGIAQVAAASHAPFISAAAPTVMNMESWRELSNPRDLTKIFQTPDYAAWNALRESEDARYLALTLPRFLSRLPYGAKTNPVEDFDFEEDTNSGDANCYAWANSAYAMAVNINRAFKQYGWCSRIRGVESGGAVEGLPVHAFPSDDGGVDMKCPTEIAIGDRRSGELDKNGFLPLIHRKNTESAAFIGAQSLQKPAEYQDPDATANANLAARLPYLFATCRFAHYLKVMVRDKVGGFTSQDALQRYLQDWILQYVDGNPDVSDDEVKARRPLAEAQVEVEAVEGDPGSYRSIFRLKPHFQLEKLSVSLRLVSKLRPQS